MRESQISVQVRRSAFGKQYRCLIRPQVEPSLLIPLLHVTQAYFCESVGSQGGKISVYRMGGEQALELLHKDLSWMERTETSVVERIREVAAWMKEHATSPAV